MFIHAVLDPDAFEGALVSQRDYLLQMKHMLRGMLENGVLLDTPDRSLKNLICRILADLPTQYGQEITALWTDLVKGVRGKRVVGCSKVKLTPLPSCGARELPRSLFSLLRCDALLVGQSDPPDALCLASYDDSELEQKRRTMLQGLVASEKTASEVRDFLLRLVKYSKWLRIYDKQIGKGNNLGAFRRGIEYILRLWYDEGHFVSAGQCSVEIFTAEREPLSKCKCDEERKQKEHENRQAFQNIERELVDKLKRRFPRLDISLKMKVDDDRITHDRYLQSQQGAVCIGKGFDFVRADGGFCDTLISYGNAATDHLRRYRELPEPCYLR